jgi:hypothetical protein
MISSKIQGLKPDPLSEFFSFCEHDNTEILPPCGGSIWEQRERLLYFLKQGPVWKTDACRRLKIDNPGRRISDLRKSGYSIDTLILYQSAKFNCSNHPIIWTKYILIDDRKDR